MILIEIHCGGEDHPDCDEIENSENGNESNSRNFPTIIPAMKFTTVVLFGMLCTLEKVPGTGGLPITTNIFAKDPSSSISFLESAAHDLLHRAVSGDIFSAKASRDIFPKRNLWELISSSSDVIPMRSKHNNGSLHFPQWSSGPGGTDSGSSLYSNGGSSTDSQMSVESRLQKLEHHFNSLRVYDDDCRQRLLCEIAESPAKFAPLSNAFLDETSYNGDEKSLASKLLETNDGARLLTYIDAAQRGSSRQSCEIWTYRCPRAASTMIDFKALLVWREISKWLTVKFVAKKHQT